MIKHINTHILFLFHRLLYNLQYLISSGLVYLVIEVISGLVSCVLFLLDD